MKSLVFLSILVLLTSCGCSGHRYERGDVVKYKVYDNEVLILDTFSRNGEPWYRVDDPNCKDCKEVSEIEICKPE